MNKSLESRRFLKVIAGIDNFDKNRVLQVVRAANQMEADCVDISAREDIVIESLNIATHTMICVSSIVPAELARAAQLGAHMIELGNYEALHDSGIFYTADEVYALAEKIIANKRKALVSITIPGHLEVSEQVKLAQRLEELGVDILQTEGASLVTTTSASALGQIEKARLSLANTIEIAKTVSETYILTASGISPDTAKFAIAAGAHGIGVGKYINKLESEIEMLAAIKAMQTSLGQGAMQFA